MNDFSGLGAMSRNLYLELKQIYFLLLPVFLFIAIITVWVQGKGDFTDKIKRVLVATLLLIGFQEILKRLCLERFLARLAGSKLSDKLIFKGGNLLRYCLPIGRQTTDLDFLMTKIKAEREAVQETFETICATQVDDGFKMTFNRLEDLEQGHMAYPGFRASLLAQHFWCRQHFFRGTGLRRA